jgi:hypothetical protein
MRDFVFQHNARALACYPAGIAAVIACGAVVSIWILSATGHNLVSSPKLAGSKHASEYQK